MNDDAEDRGTIEASEFDRIQVMEAGLVVLRELRAKGPLQVVMAKAKADAMVAVEELVKCDPDNGKLVRELQWKVSRYDALHLYVSEIVEEGRAASDDLTDDRRAFLEQQLDRD